MMKMDGKGVFVFYGRLLGDVRIRNLDEVM